MTTRGVFITLEGIDGSGKSTQCRRLAETLRAEGRDVVLTREPGGSPGAEEIRRLLVEGDPDRWSGGTEILLFTAARRDHLEKTIRPALAAGRIVVSDRFADSTRVYQGAARGDLRGFVDRLHEMAIGVEPDLTLVIDMDPEAALNRSLARLGSMYANANALNLEKNIPRESLLNKIVGWVRRGRALKAENSESRFEELGAAFQARLRDGFLALAAEAPARCRVIDGNRDADAVARDIRAAVAAVLP